MQIFAIILAVLAIAATSPFARADATIVLAQGAHGPTGEPPADATTPEERMRRRFPQPARVGDLIGLPVLDPDDVTLGRVRQIVRTSEGKILLIVAYGGWFGWGARPVAVPIEVVAILGRQIAALEMSPDDFAKAPTWSGNGAQSLVPDEIIRIAVTRR